MPKIAKGTWVEIHDIVLPAGKRAPQVPDDTRAVPLEMRAKGILCDDAAIGEEVEIITAAGRTLKGVLVEANPAYTHGFGAPIAELIPIGGEARQMLRQRKKDR
jgi:hypothetical protein